MPSPRPAAVAEPTDVLAGVESLPQVPEALAGARAAVDRLLAHRVLLRSSATVAGEVALRCARASAALEGADHPLAQVRAGCPDPVVHGALRVAAGLGELLPVVRRAPSQALARLHVLAAAGLAEPADLGRPRTADLPGAPPAGEVAPRLAALAQLVAASRASALVLAAVAHAELLALAPFASGSGLVARGFARLLLVERGLDPKAVLPVDVGHAADPDGYARALLAYRDGDVAAWVVHVASAAQAGAVEGLAVCEAVRRG